MIASIAVIEEHIGNYLTVVIIAAQHLYTFWDAPH